MKLAHRSGAAPPELMASTSPASPWREATGVLIERAAHVQREGLSHASATPEPPLPQPDPVHCSLPGGRVKHGEGILEALVREVGEETGLLIVPNRLLYVAEVLSGRGVHDLNLVFLANLRETSARTTDPELLDLDDPAAASVPPPCIDRVRQGVEDGWSGTPEWLGNVWDEQLGVS